MSDSYLSAARDLVVVGMRESQIALAPELEFHLASTVASYMRRPVRTDYLTTRLMEMRRTRGREECRRIGDDCLISCAFFLERLTRHGGSVVHYAGLGQAAYDGAGMTDVAIGFPLMLDVLHAISSQQIDTPAAAEDDSVLGNLLKPTRFFKH